MAPAMPCKTRQEKKALERPVANPMRSNQWIHKTADGRIFTESSWGPCCKKTHSLQHDNLVHKFLSYASSHEHSRSKSSSGLEKTSRVEFDESQKQIRGDRWSKDEARKSSFCLTDEYLSFEVCRIGRQNTKNTKIELYSEARLWKTIQGLTQFSLNKDLQHLKWQPPRSWISSPDCRVAMDKQQAQYRRIPKWKWKMLTNCWKFQDGVSRHLDSSTTDTNGLNHGPLWKTQSFPLQGIYTVILLAGLIWERQFEKVLLKHGWGKIPNWECLVVHHRKGLFLSVYVDDIKLGGKNKTLIRCGNNSTKKSI